MKNKTDPAFGSHSKVITVVGGVINSDFPIAREGVAWMQTQYTVHNVCDFNFITFLAYN